MNRGIRTSIREPQWSYTSPGIALVDLKKHLTDKDFYETLDKRISEETRNKSYEHPSILKKKTKTFAFKS